MGERGGDEGGREKEKEGGEERERDGGENALVDVPEGGAPAKAGEDGVAIVLEAGDVERGGEGFDAVEPPGLAVVCGVGGEEVGYCSCNV